MKQTKLTFLAIGLLALAGCASTAEKNVNAEVKQQEGIHTTAQAATTGRMEIMASDKLTKEQKDKFMELMGKTQAKTVSLREESAKLKAALFEQLTQAKYDHKEISVYKSKIQKVEKQKMDLMFNSLDEVRKILGASAKDPDVLKMYRERTEW
jgi:Spy/CpxP family protein refolding chaperone